MRKQTGLHVFDAAQSPPPPFLSFPPPLSGTENSPSIVVVGRYFVTVEWEAFGCDWTRVRNNGWGGRVRSHVSFPGLRTSISSQTSLECTVCLFHLIS